MDVGALIGPREACVITAAQTDQVEIDGLTQQLDVGAAAVDTRLEVHLVPEGEEEREVKGQLCLQGNKRERLVRNSYWTTRGLVSKVKGRSSWAEMA